MGLSTHKKHGHRQGYSLFNKNAILLSIILQELERPANERLYWLDSDTVLMNLNIPFETFLPPPYVLDIDMLLIYDWNRMNNGAFLIHIHPWSIELLSAAIAHLIMSQLDTKYFEYLQIHLGDLLVYFLSTCLDNGSKTMRPFLEIAEARRPNSELPLERTGYAKVIEAFWTGV
ncbi:hypothetical protein BGW36DRAFT_402050 [Talaromyces proteolyticus]|uniref:Uncharacterized protein n=1 Tax=Talaromyces proteolyticus TaxID=1131652 RepID=A0AAD4PU66_9EURO|nr:uncharacterized protein BGW36DRAFT_402050 [Talaromyces proteolyticus]KAH8688985.1 hypothetical protein BGW36DRAFT_402050 [Talaromyces proteolyticus]